MTSQPSTVQLLATCLIETLRPEAGMAVVRVLEKIGLQVEYPEGQTCCGQPAFNGGAFDDARAMGRHTLDVLCGDLPAERLYNLAPIVVPSGSCADMIVHHYPELFAADPVYGPRAEAVAKRTYEFSQFLVDVLGVSDLGARFPGKVAYHPSCHLLRALEESLEEFAGVAIVVSHDRWFLDRICTHIIAFEGESIAKMYIGNWSDYEEMMMEKFGKDLQPHRVKYRTLKR